MTSTLDKYILGSNPLSGIDHFLAERARERALFINSSQIISIIEHSLMAGALGYNFPTSDAMIHILKTLKAQEFNKPLGLYPIIPDTQSYVSSQLRNGTVGMIIDILSSLGWSSRASLLIRGGISMVTMDPLRALTIVLDVEIAKVVDNMPKNARLKAVFLHEAATDLAIAYNAQKAFETYIDHIKNNYDIIPGFVTRNFTRFVSFCNSTNINLNDIAIMTPFNKIGFQMTPSRKDCEQTLSQMRNGHVIVMSLLAGGQIKLDEALDYLRSLKAESVAIGVSNEAQARETFEKLTRTW